MAITCIRRQIELLLSGIVLLIVSGSNVSPIVTDLLAFATSNEMLHGAFIQLSYWIVAYRISDINVLRFLNDVLSYEKYNNDFFSSSQHT